MAPESPHSTPARLVTRLLTSIFSERSAILRRIRSRSSRAIRLLRELVDHNDDDGGRRRWFGAIHTIFPFICFRNPIQAAPVTLGERLCGIISQWHLLSHRCAIPSRSAELTLLMASGVGLSRQKIASHPRLHQTF
jgi:hypothetical protein